MLGRNLAEDALQTATQRAEAAGAGGVTVVLSEDDPAQALLAQASERDADLIVVGNRGINHAVGPAARSVPVDMAHRAP